MPPPHPPRAPDAWVSRQSQKSDAAGPLPVGRRLFRAAAAFVAQTFGRRHEDRKLTLSLLVPPAALGLCLWLLASQVTADTGRDLMVALAGVTPGQWLASIVFTGMSYIAIGRNDALAHRLIGSPILAPRARRAGRAAVAIAQAVGFGAITAAVTRKRLLPEIELWTLARVSVAATLAFLVAITGLSLAAYLYLRTGAPWLSISALCVAFVFARVLRPLTGLPGLSRIRAAQLLLWTALDVGFAACALWVLLPTGSAVPLMTVAAAYTIALGIGLVSQSPGGLGAFEVLMILLLPQVPAGELLAAILVYRVTYHILPALAAVPHLLQKPRPPDALPLLAAEGRAIDRALHRAGQGDWGLVHQGAQLLLSRDQSSGWLCRETGATLTALGRPLGTPRLRDLTSVATARGLTPFLYKCDARTASHARRLGWSVKLLSQEALVFPGHWSADGPAKRQLRRKLRGATKAGLRIDMPTTAPPLDDLAAVHAAWTHHRGPERGYSMGQFSADLVKHQRVFVGYLGEEAVAFVTFHQTGSEWGLDLMRLRSSAPSGTMQALVTAAISAARQSGIQRISLAACLHPKAGLPGWVPKEDGIQFKASFDPHWRPLYVAAPSAMTLAQGLASTTLAIHFPVSAVPPKSRKPKWLQLPKNRFELTTPPCEAAAPPSSQANVGPSPDPAWPTRSARDDRPSDNPS